MLFACVSYVFEDGGVSRNYVPMTALDDECRRSLRLIDGGEWDDIASDPDLFEDLEFISKSSRPFLPPGACVHKTYTVYIYDD